MVGSCRMPSNIMNQRRVSPFCLHSDTSSFFSEELLFPTEQVGFQKPESLPDQYGSEGVALRSGSQSVSSSPLNKLNLLRGYSNYVEDLELSRPSISKHQKSKLSIENHLMDLENGTHMSANIVKDADGNAMPQSVLLTQPTPMFAEGNKNKSNMHNAYYENGLFSSSLSEIFNKKLTLSSNPLGQSVNTDNSNFEEDEPFESMEELEAQTIGNLLPDDDDLLSGITDDFGYVNRPNNTDDDDIFCTGGGMELEGDDCLNKISELFGGVSDGHQGAVNGSFAGEHPFGEHPSRTLFVRNINSNVEDSELKALFEQYGDVRALYTACKHRGFVMISYYDIRSARNAIKALQNKPLRRRQLDIHYSIPKDNPSEKDINQGTLVVFNLDSSVSNDDLRQIFGVYGEIKEIRETPHKNHHKFIEFFDVRAADSALHALNRSDIAGKKIKLEPSRPGGARRCSLMQQLSPEIEQEKLNACNQGSPHNTLSSCYDMLGSISVGANTTNILDNGAMQSLNTCSRTPVTAFLDTAYRGVSSSVTQDLSSPVRISSVGNHNHQAVHEDYGHSVAQMNFGYSNFPSFHPHSLPEFHNGVNNCISFTPNALSPGVISVNSRSAEGIDNRNVHRVGSGSLSSHCYDHNEAFGISGNGSCPLHGHQYVWNNSNVFHHSPTGPVIWSNSPSFLNNIPTNPPPHMHGVPRTASHLLNTVLPLHNHVGSAPTMNPSLWDKRHSYARDSKEPPFHPGLLGSMNFSGTTQLHPLELASRNGFPHVSGNCIDPSISAAHFGISSPQQRMFHGRTPMMSMPGSFDSLSDRIRSRRNDSNASQADNKKQYELDIDRILCGEDSRTTLMIKNIPNKYTSKMLLAAIDENHRGTYDFIYLPIDFKNKCNVGYAFINMTDPEHIIPFYQTFNGKKWEKFNSEKVASLAYARIQGKTALIAHFQNSSLMNEDKRCRPILFHSDGPNAGDQEPFPTGLNIRSRSGRSRTMNGSEENLGSPSTPANGDKNSDTSSPKDYMKDME